MANSFEQAFEQLSDEQLRQASEEHVRWRETALLDDTASYDPYMDPSVN